VPPSLRHSADPRDPEDLRVVLADDHPLFRAGLRALLDAHPGMQVIVEVDDGLGAVEAARTENPDVVVMDASMPGMNGVEATSRIATEQPGVKVLCLSMHSDRFFVEGMLRAGASGYVLKECVFDELIAAIHAVVGGQVYLSPGLADSVLKDYRAEGERGESSALDRLTPREREVLQLLAEGHTTQDIAGRLYVSAKTTHREHLMQKLNTRSVAGLTKLAIREGLTSVEE